MTDEIKAPHIERPYRLSIGDQLWERALQDYAHPVLQKRIRDARGFHDDLQRATSRITGIDASMNANVVRENIMFRLIRDAAYYLYENDGGRISAGDISKLLTTDKFSVSELTVRARIQEKYPFLIEYYGLFVRSYDKINKDYGEAISSLWNEQRKQPSIDDIAKRLGLAYTTVRDKLRGKNKSDCPPWLITLYKKGPSADPNEPESQ